MPLTYGFTGWFTNLVALEMMFYPLEFRGIPPYLGWQGVVPRKAYKMADKAVRLITERLLRIEDLADRINPYRVERELRPLLNKTIDQMIRNVVDKLSPNLWFILPDGVKERILEQGRNEFNNAIRKVIREIKQNINEVFDLRELAMKNLTGPNVRLIVDMFQRIGAPEFKFIKLSGFYFGLLLGLVQVALWKFFPFWWTLPVQGVIVGYLTNWLALRMIFRPLHPKRYGPFTYQGLFLKRQDAVSCEFANLAAENILTARKIMEEIYYGKAADEVLRIIRGSVTDAVENAAGAAGPVLSVTVGTKKYNELKGYVIEEMIKIGPEAIDVLEDYMKHTLQVEKMMYEKMRVLPPEEFESILRGPFQEEEFLLLLVGSILGAGIGLLQAFYMIAFG